MDTRVRAWNEFRVSLAILAVVALLPLVITGVYWQGVILVSMYYAVLSAGWNLQLGYAGQISLAPATFAMLGAYTTGLLSFHLGVPPLAGIAIAVAVALVIGAALGTIVLRLRGPYLALTTLAFAEVMRNVVVASPSVTRGDMGLTVAGITDNRLFWYYTFLVLLVLVQTGLYLLLRSPAGLYLQAIRDDDVAARARGVRVVFWKNIAFVIGAGLSGLAGALYAHFSKVATPHLGTLYQAGLVIAMVIIGGMGSLVGPLIGAFLVWGLTEALRETAQYQAIIFAFLVIVFARFFPAGLWGLVLAMGRRRRASPAPTGPAAKSAAAPSTSPADGR